MVMQMIGPVAWLDPFHREMMPTAGKEPSHESMLCPCSFSMRSLKPEPHLLVLHHEGVVEVELRRVLREELSGNGPEVILLEPGHHWPESDLRFAKNQVG